MSYTYTDNTLFSQQLESLIHKLHAFVGNAITRNRYIVFGAGSTQVLNAAAYALSLENTSSQSPTRVVASIPYYSLYKNQMEYFNSEKFKFEGDAYTWQNRSDGSANVIEFVTAPNNPDGRLSEAILDDRAYFQPRQMKMSWCLHFPNLLVTLTQAADLGKQYAQFRAFKLLKTVLEEGTGIFDFAYRTMKSRWERLTTPPIP
ncbi:hypothetical protein V6N12_059874 [Hibiscus sabdariffa]|uniref:Alliinase C-terminal domain-containing protein n=1 Tax=Hibiscus sabdariffa TaxID=183260 RepID=A0ABR2BCE5_9ROSI